MQSDRVFGAAVRRRYNLIVSVATFLAAALPFAVGLLILELVWPHGKGLGPMIVAAAALILGPVATWATHNRLGLAGNETLRAKLRRRIREEGHTFPEGVDPVFVGFSPTDQPLAWDGDTDRDIGFLAAWGDALVYYGDDFTWYLPRSRIDIIEPIQPAAGVPRILIRWHAPRESNRSFTIVSREASDLRGARQATMALLQQLYAWVARPPQTDREAPKLGMPPTDASGGTPIDSAPGGSCAVLAAIFAATAVAAWQVAGPMVDAEQYAYAALWSGLVFVGGFGLTTAALRLLQWAEEQDAADERADGR